MKVKFNKKLLYNYYIEDAESDLNEIYHRFETYFGNNSDLWYMEGTHDEIEEMIYQHIWKPLRRGDYILQRYLNSNLAKEVK